MTPDALQIGAPLLAAIGLAALVFARVGAAALFLPAFGEQRIPARVRLFAAIGFTLIVAPAIVPSGEGPKVDSLIHGLGAEALSGLILGFSVRSLIWALQIAGAMAAQTTSLAQMAGGAADQSETAIGAFLTISGLALATLAGLHVRVAALFILSYRLLPLGRFPLAPDVIGWSFTRIGEVFTLALSLAAPFLIAGLLYNIALSALNRALPKLAVTFIGAPLLTFASIALLAVAGPAILDHWLARFLANLDAPF
ncbi:MAG: flagellar biosynthetic protein FliR [Paracoccaceae bacterium]|nr:flagellar biosynthetic protein FliR [Paracoccaceae bacterium]